MTKPPRPFIATTALAALTALTACAPSRAEPEAPEVATSRERPPVHVTLTEVRQVPVDLPLTLKGRVVHDRDLALSFKTGGLIAEVLVDEGDRVKAGDVVARLDPGELQAGLAQAQAGLMKANRDLARVAELEAQAVLPGTTREDAQTARAVAAAQVRGVRWNLATATLTAETDGLVIKRLAQPGEVVGPGQPVLIVADERDETRVEVGLPARELSRIAPGLPGLPDLPDLEVSLTLDGHDGAPITGRLVDIAPTLTPGTDRVAVAFALPRDLRPPRGLVATVTMPARPTPTRPAIPLSAIVEGSGQEASVWLLDDATGASARGPRPVVRRPITIAEVRPDGLVTVERGLEGVTAVVELGQGWLDAATTVLVKATAPGVTP